jgi:phage terminase large subunit
MASEYILGGSRKSGKTFTIYILSVIACMALNDTIVLIDRLRSNKRIDSFSQVLFIIFNLLNGGPAIRSISKGEMSITFHNNSIILFRSVYDPNGLVQMTGIPRKNYQLALLINEECNPYEEK